MQIASLPEQEGEDDFLVDQIIPAGEDTIIFGDGSSGKTTLCYAMIAAMALGPDAGGHLSFANFRGKWAPTLIIDYETSGKKARLYVRRVFEGMGIPSDLLEEMPVFFWPAKGTPIWDLVEPLKRFIAKHNIKVIVVDAGGDACGGEPSKEYAALGYFNALDRLGEDLTTITICHMTHADNNESAKFRPYGSRYWHNRARRTWYVHRVQEEDSDEIDIALFCRKVNYGRKPRPISFRLSYIGTTGPIVFRSQDIAVVPEFEDDRPVVDRITEYLRKLMQPDTIANIAGALNIKLETVSGTLYRHKDKRFVNIPAGMGRGAQHKWALMAQGEPA